jgi:ABC-type glycerol-3-phosphate transport system permease component
LGIHEQSETELEHDGKCSNRTRKVLRGIILTILIAFSWVGTLHLLKMSFKSEKILVAINQFSTSNFSESLNNNKELSETSTQVFSIFVLTKIIF